MSEKDRPDPQESKRNKPRLVDRRKVLGGLVAAGGATVVGPAIAVAQPARRRDDQNRNDQNRDNQNRDRGRADGPGAPNNDQDNRGPTRFSRMFGDEGPLLEVDDDLRRSLAELGAPGGILDAKDQLDAGPIALITDLELSVNNPNNPDHTAGTTFMGQFLDHDITSDAGSPLGQPTSVLRSANLRSARFDLDSVYGGGPDASRRLYTADDPYQFRVESGGLFEDLPRDSAGVAIIADGRNDENVIISGLQVAFLLFHNALLVRARAEGFEDRAAFEQARRQAIWHYQWLIMRQFLPQFVGQPMIDDVLRNGRRHYTATAPSIPVEFQTSAYRFGHSMIRPSYRVNLAGDQGEPFFGMVFDPNEFGNDDPDDLSGGHRAPRRFLGWQTFFDFDDGEVKPNKIIDTHISTPLFQLPMGSIATSRGEPIGPLSLPVRNLLRHITWQIPSGEQVAAAMGVPRLAPADVDDIATVAPQLAGATPLWLYILREAAVVEGGRRLGPVGGRIVAEVFIGLLQMDPLSILNAGADWRSPLPTRGGEFRMVDLLTEAGVDPKTRGQ